MTETGHKNRRGRKPGQEKQAIIREACDRAAKLLADHGRSGVPKASFILLIMLDRLPSKKNGRIDVPADVRDVIIAALEMYDLPPDFVDLIKLTVGAITPETLRFQGNQAKAHKKAVKYAAFLPGGIKDAKIAALAQVMDCSWHTAKKKLYEPQFIKDVAQYRTSLGATPAARQARIAEKADLDEFRKAGRKGLAKVIQEVSDSLRPLGGSTKVSTTSK